MAQSRSGLAPGKQITKGVSLLKPLGAGGMGAVWLADHLGLKTHVVVKFMLGGLDATDAARVRFSREASAAAQVKSPHVVQMLDHGVSDDGIPFIIMEHLEGHDLGEEIERRGALDPAMVVAIVVQIAKALSKVHSAGLLHRDIKPDNIFLVDGEEEVFVKLLDFGIAKRDSSADGASDDGSLDGQTKTGQVVGTPFYMSPEQVTAQKHIDYRSDLWALGVVAYEALTGIRPYDGPSFGALAVMIATGRPKPPTEANANLPAALDAWFAKACAREPDDRFSSAKEMAEAFRACFEGVVSLPASAAISSDSGQRSRTNSSRGANVVSSSGPKDVPATLELATTALDDSDSARRASALARSEGGVSSSSGGGATPSGRMLYVAGAVVLSIAVGGAVLRAFGSGSSNDRPTTERPAPASAPRPPPSTVASPSAVVSAAPSVSAPVASASSEPPSAPPTRTTITSPPTPATSHAPSPPSHPPLPPPTKPGSSGSARPEPSKSPEPSSRPTASPRPTDTAPDLF